MNRRGFLLSAGAAALAGCDLGVYDPTLPDACYEEPGCSPEALPEGTLLNGTAQKGETQWDVVRRLWPDYEPADMAFMVFDPDRGYVFPEEDDFDSDWNYVCVAGEQVLFLTIESIA